MSLSFVSLSHILRQFPIFWLCLQGMNLSGFYPDTCAGEGEAFLRCIIFKLSLACPFPPIFAHGRKLQATKKSQTLQSLVVMMETTTKRIKQQQILYLR